MLSGWNMVNAVDLLLLIFVVLWKSAFENEIISVSGNFISRILISKISVKRNLRIISKNHAADPEIGFPTKSISRPYGRATDMPTAWQLKNLLLSAWIEISSAFLARSSSFLMVSSRLPIIVISFLFSSSNDSRKICSFNKSFNYSVDI